MAYIKIEKAIAEIDKGDLLVGNNAEWAKEILFRTPTADVVEVKHGEWSVESDEEMPNPMFKLVVCSVCNKKANRMYNYCPNCGADMRGGKND